MHRLALVVFVVVSLVAAPSAAAWTWPLGGPVLRPYSVGPDPYAAGQHRGVDVSGTSGEPALAPAAGTVSFAGVVPTHGKTVTIQTADGYAVSLTHLGEIGVAKGDAVAEGERIGQAGASGDPEWPTPYVHLGIRISPAADGYVDPSTLLPTRAVQPPAPSEPVATQSATPAPVTAPPGEMPRSTALALPEAAAPAAARAGSQRRRCREPR